MDGPKQGVRNDASGSERRLRACSELCGIGIGHVSCLRQARAEAEGAVLCFDISTKPARSNRAPNVCGSIGTSVSRMCSKLHARALSAVTAGENAAWPQHPSDSRQQPVVQCGRRNSPIPGNMHGFQDYLAAKEG